MATGDDGPLRQGAREGLDWFLVAIEACGGETSDLGYFLEVWAFIGEVGVEKVRGPHRKSTRHRGTPPPLWGPPDSPLVDFCYSIFHIFQKNLR